MTNRKSYLTVEGRISLIFFPEELSSAEELEDYIACTAADLAAIRQAHLERIAVRKVSIEEVLRDQSRSSQLETLQARARRQLQKMKAGD